MTCCRVSALQDFFEILLELLETILKWIPYIEFSDRLLWGSLLLVRNKDGLISLES